MPTTYEKARPDVHQLVKEVQKEFHTELSQNGVNVGVIFARNSEGAAVKKSGYPVAGKISVVSLKDRCEKDYEAEMVIDVSWWTESTTKHHRALIDHELSHLELVEDPEEGGFKTDDQGRPCLKIRNGDWYAGDGFKSVVERHGDYAVEIACLRKAEAQVSEVKNRLFKIDTPPPEEPPDTEGDTVVITPETAKQLADNIDEILAWKNYFVADLKGISPKLSQACGQMELSTVGKFLAKCDQFMEAAPKKPAKNYLASHMATYLGLKEADASKVIKAVYDLEEAESTKKGAA